MNNQETVNLQKTGSQVPIKCTILWLGFCLLGAILYFVLPIESGWTSEQIRESITNAYTPTSKDFWIFLILSVRFEMCFLLFLTLLSQQSNRTVLFCGRGLLFGFGGMDILLKTDLYLFFMVVVRQALFISLFLYYDGFLCSKQENNHKNHRSFVGIVLLCEFGVSLLIQFCFLYIISKI